MGDQNKFYFDEKLGRWVEEGAPAVEAEAPLAPPPIIASANASSSALHPHAFEFFWYHGRKLVCLRSRAAVMTRIQCKLTTY